MLLAATDAERIAGALLNDIGPEIDQAGIDRIGGYVGKDSALRRLGRGDRRAAPSATPRRFPDWGAGEWERFVRRICREDEGQIRFDYDMAIADNFARAAGKPQIDAWPFYRALDGRPVTILRGELSDLLSDATARAMVERARRCRTGHRARRRPRAQPRRARKPRRDRPACSSACCAR